MQKMYEDYRDQVEFRLVYIKEAHAADGSWPVGYAKEKKILEHTDYEHRCSTASRFLTDESLTIPTIIDGMDNKVNEAYKGWPDRVYLVRKDGKLGVASQRGPWGFVPALNAAKEWLAYYKKTGKEMELGKPELATGGSGFRPRFGEVPPRFRLVVGVWDMKTAFQGNSIEATMTILVKEGELSGAWASMGRRMEMTDVKLDGNKLTFKRTMGMGGQSLQFTGTIEGDQIVGKYAGSFGEFESSGQRKSSTASVAAQPPPEFNAEEFTAVVGEWRMKMDFMGRSVEATLALSMKDGKPVGTWSGRRGESKVTNLGFAGGKLSFTRSMGGGRGGLEFEGAVKGDKITGKYSGPFGEFECNGERKLAGEDGTR